MIYIGCDTHKQSHTLVAITELGEIISSKKIKNNEKSFSEVLNWPIVIENEVMWGVENSQHYGKHLAQFLIQNGQKVFEISPKLTAQLRGRSLKQDKTDKLDALAIAKALLQEKEKLHLVPSKHSIYEELKELTRFRDSLVKKRTDYTNLLHKSLFNLEPDYKDKIGNLRSKKSLKEVKNFYLNDFRSKTKIDKIYRLEIEILLKIIHEVDSQIKILEKDYIKELLEKINSPLATLTGVGKITEAVLLGEIGDISNYKKSAQLASRGGLCPIENSSAKNRYRRVNPGGNRRINCAVHIIAMSQLRNKSEGYNYYHRKKSEGKTSKEALRCLKRKLVDIIFSMLKNNKEYYTPKSLVIAA